MRLNARLQEVKDAKDEQWSQIETFWEDEICFAIGVNSSNKGTCTTTGRNEFQACQSLKNQFGLPWIPRAQQIERLKTQFANL